MTIVFVGISLSFTGRVHAQVGSEQYTDVEAGVWYEQAVDALLGAGALDASEVRLRPNDLATRAEIAKLLVLLNDVDLSVSTSGFTDVSPSSWYFAYMEAAARLGWIRGDGNCYDEASSLCYARPSAPVNRAEMAVILQRAFSLSHAGSASVFPDNTNTSMWYYLPIQTAADHCVLQGDARTGRVRPADYMNRAEMITMFYRASVDLRYGEDCGVDVDVRGDIQNVSAQTARRIQVTFNTNIHPDDIGNISAYEVWRVSGGGIDVQSVSVLNARTVTLFLAGDLIDGSAYHVEVEGMRTEQGIHFDDTRVFTFFADEADPFIQEVSVQNDGNIRITFSQDIVPARANDAFRYSLAQVSNNTQRSIIRARVINDKMIDLEVDAMLASHTTYRLEVEAMYTEDNEIFSDVYVFSTGDLAQAMLDSITVASSSRVRLHFSTELDEGILRDEFRYRVIGAEGEVQVRTAFSPQNRTVELLLESGLKDGEYTVYVENLQTEGGVIFDDEHTFTFDDDTSESAIEDITVYNGNILRVEFRENIAETYADDTFRYQVTHVDNDILRTIDRVTVINNRIVDIAIQGMLSLNATYRLDVNNMRTAANVEFSDSSFFTSENVLLPMIDQITPVHASRVQMTFNTDIDDAFAEDAYRYRIVGIEGDVTIASVFMVNENTVELILDQNLISQVSYSGSVLGMHTVGGQTFSDQQVFTYENDPLSMDAALRGENEVPPVSTSATGEGAFTLSENELMYDIIVYGMSSTEVTAAHFHLGEEGEEGASVESIELGNDLRATGTWNLSSAEREALFEGSIYVNVHTNAYPDGEIRGQILR